VDECRTAYRTQAGPKVVDAYIVAARETTPERDNYWMYWQLDDYNCSLEEYTARAYNQAVCTYAVVQDGKWSAKGDMGWFGCSSNDVDEVVWQQKLREMLFNLPPETMVTVCDCRI
jgi:hypothetical protein